jgi:16S rRNA (cytosine1402-N4)-methyltransferase
LRSTCNISSNTHPSSITKYKRFVNSPFVGAAGGAREGADARPPQSVVHRPAGTEEDSGAWDTPFHAPVLIDAVLSGVAEAKRVLDGTLGGGGHAAALLEHGIAVDGMDRDPDAVQAASRRLADYAARGQFRSFLAATVDIDTIPALAQIRYDAVLLDLGVSSHQLNTDERGFSFRPGIRLDMRMAGAGADSPPSAAQWLMHASEEELATAFRRGADEPRAGRLAREIVRRRGRGAFDTSDDLVRAIRAALGAKSGPADFARLFQAVRIAINDELGVLTESLSLLRDHLRPGGRFLVIAYHSGEDRIVKDTFRDWSRACHCPPRQPLCTCGGQPLGALITRRPLTPSAAELARNPRSRSAKLRIWQRAP